MFSICYDIVEFAKFYINHIERFSYEKRREIQKQLAHFYYDDLCRRDKFIKKRIRKSDFVYADGHFSEFRNLTVSYFKEVARINKYILNN